MESTLIVKYPQVRVCLTGRCTDVFTLLSNVVNAMRRHGLSNAEVGRYYNEAVLTPGVDQSYDNVLRVTMAWVTVS